MDRRILVAATLAAVLLAAVPAAFGNDAVDMTATPKVVEDVAATHSTSTDTNTLNREKEAISRQPRNSAEKYEFQAEVTRLMDIIIHSLYSNKDVFLRELISNASDALDKIRFLSLTDPSLLGEGDAAILDIKLWLDPENKVLYLRDKGIGMTKDDLVKNLGTIAKSGTAAFLETMQKGGDMNLIGQFGLGFYSVYLVADYVEVISKSNDDDKQWIWESGADGNFAVSEDTENEPLGRGTLIKIFLKDETHEYAQEHKLRELVTRYSEFINFPIYLQTMKEVEVPVEEEEAAEEAKEEEAEEEAEEGDDVEDDEEEEGETAEEKPKKTRKEKRQEWDLLNDNKAIWLRKPKDITKEDYQKFYKAITKDYADALTWSHFKAEGDVEFKSILFIPAVSPYDFYDKYYERSPRGVKLYVRRVFISDEFDDFLPRYLSFMKGLVDSDTLPLNVSREMLQAHASLKTIKKKLVRKALDMIRKMAEDERKCKGLDKKDNDDDGEENDEKPSEEECGKYKTFFGQFGKALKLGIIEDATNRNRLAKLLRFQTSKTEAGELTSLEEYVNRMKEGQQHIYYLAGTSLDDVKNSPFLERLHKKGYEVIYFTDVLDEYMMGHLMEYDDKKFMNASKEDLKMSDKDEEEKKRDKELKEEFKDLTKWWKKLVGESSLTAVKVSNRLTTTPCVVVSSKYGQSANMERIQRAQAFANSAAASTSKGQRTLEINPRHPLIKSLKEKVAVDEDDVQAKTIAALLFETSLLESGFEVDNVKEFNKKLYTLMKGAIGMEAELEAVEEEVEEPAAEEAEEPVAAETEEPAAEEAEHEEL